MVKDGTWQPVSGEGGKGGPMLTKTGFWRLKEDAIKGGRGPWHKQARSIISQMYEEINVKGLRLTIEDEVEAWTIRS